MNKTRQKKKYRPRTVAVPNYLAGLDSSIGKKQELGREDDRLFLLRVANRTADNQDLVLQCHVFMAAWLLAERMEDAKAIRSCLYDGVAAIGAYLDEDQTSFTQAHFETLAQATDIGRSVMENSGKMERAKALQAVFEGRFTPDMMQRAELNSEKHDSL